MGWTAAVAVGEAVGATAALGAVGGAIVGGAIVGAAVGGVTAAVTGGDIMKGVLVGGLVGAAGAGIGAAMGGTSAVGSGIASDVGSTSSTGALAASSVSPYAEAAEAAFPASEFGMPAGISAPLTATPGGAVSGAATGGGMLSNPYTQGMIAKGGIDALSGVAKGIGAADAQATQNQWTASQKVVNPNAGVSPATPTIGGKSFVDSSQLSNLAASPEASGQVYKIFTPSPQTQPSAPVIK